MTSMENTLAVLLMSALGIGFVHTLIGIDHTLPFVVLGRANNWSLRKTLALTGVCGLAHVGSSVVLGLLGVGLGAAVTRIEGLEASRGTLAAWVLILFGLAYAGWAMARRRRKTCHIHRHTQGLVHVHPHDDPAHGHSDAGPGPGPRGGVPSPVSITAWSLFIIFVLGPCEPLIPLLMIPASTMGATSVALVSATFAAVTIGTMLLLVTLGFYGLRMPRMQWLERHAQVAAGLAIAASGVVIKLFGL